jgi:hypothetical protein
VWFGAFRRYDGAMSDRRKPGRPCLDPSSPSTKICLRVSGKDYDAIYARARAERMTVPEFVRAQIARAQAVIKTSRM